MSLQLLKILRPLEVSIKGLNRVTTFKLFFHIANSPRCRSECKIANINCAHDTAGLKKSKQTSNNSKKCTENLFTFNVMDSATIEEALGPLKESIAKQGNLIRELKAKGAPDVEIKSAVAELQLQKKQLEESELKISANSISFDRAKVENLLKRRFFYDQSFSIYGGLSGQYDYGPMGCAVKANILSEWRKFFSLEEQMLEIDCSILTPEPVLKASGHVDRFTDFMVKDVETGECFRLDHLIKNALEKIASANTASNEMKAECTDVISKLDGMTKQEMKNVLDKFEIKSPGTNNALSEPTEFNLMFGTQIGPSSLVKGYLRPETAQGIFVNFKRLLEFNQGKLPFAAAQIGTSFRNEISPRSGLIRVREFTMAEIEHFYDPAFKNHPKFQTISHTEMLLYSACNQMDGKPAQRFQIGEAVKAGLVANEILGYYMARIYKFLRLIGIKENCLRFRQHMNNEMAHYASDCWDAECLTSYGWVECVGCADRSAYDLTQHMQATGIRMVAERSLSSPIAKEVSEIVPNKAALGKLFKKDCKTIIDALSKLSINDVKAVEKDLETKKVFVLKENGKEFQLSSDVVAVKNYTKQVHIEEIIPNVVEPSFGIGRIMYAILEQNFKCREEDAQRSFFSLAPIIAPVKCIILPLLSKPEFSTLLQKLSTALTEAELSHKVDDSSGSIGRRYARADEIAVPYGITVDYESLQEPHSVTLRERDSMTQIRISVENVVQIVRNLSIGKIKWEQLLGEYPLFEQQSK